MEVGGLRPPRGPRRDGQPGERRGGPGQEYTKVLYKKVLHDPDNHNGVITHLEPDIPECAVKWALGTIPTNKTSGSDEILAELF